MRNGNKIHGDVEEIKRYYQRKKHIITNKLVEKECKRKKEEGQMHLKRRTRGRQTQRQCHMICHTCNISQNHELVK